ncbi:hypothetical protein TorRG33x02_277120 [Trema orientale]|uniref:Uncharacterized protein n=1 Tax=Trema orientale TaxID=63057 RepID=A0A2P5CQ43_TREOI|nr:hypothetical protein TorRG33x02_277120 [Trema orientale]
MVRLNGGYDLLFSSINGFDSQAAVSLVLLYIRMN